MNAETWTALGTVGGAILCGMVWIISLLLDIRGQLGTILASQAADHAAIRKLTDDLDGLNRKMSESVRKLHERIDGVHDEAAVLRSDLAQFRGQAGIPAQPSIQT